MWILQQQLHYIRKDEHWFLAFYYCVAMMVSRSGVINCDSKLFPVQVFLGLEWTYCVMILVLQKDSAFVSLWRYFWVVGKYRCITLITQITHPKPHPSPRVETVVTLPPVSEFQPQPRFLMGWLTNQQELDLSSYLLIFVYLFHVFVCFFVCLLIHLSACLLIYLYVCLSVCTYVSLSICVCLALYVCTVSCRLDLIHP